MDNIVAGSKVKLLAPAFGIPAGAVVTIASVNAIDPDLFYTKRVFFVPLKRSEVQLVGGAE